MSGQRLTNLLSRVGIPDADLLVTSADDAFAIGAEGDIVYWIRMSCERLADLLSRAGVPDADCLVTTTDDASASGAEGDVMISHKIV